MILLFAFCHLCVTKRLGGRWTFGCDGGKATSGRTGGREGVDDVIVVGWAHVGGQRSDGGGRAGERRDGHTVRAGSLNDSVKHFTIFLAPVMKSMKLLRSDTTCTDPSLSSCSDEADDPGPT